MIFLNAYMRSGSHLAAAIMGLEPYVAHNEQTGVVYPADVMIERLSSGRSFWSYYPYDDKVAKYLRGSKIKRVLLVRDPRDIIVSTAHFCEKYPRTFMNFNVNGKMFVEYSIKERIDMLINVILYDSLHNFDKWRTSGMFLLLRYSEIVHNPIAGVYHNWLRRGVVGGYKDEMTCEQVELCNGLYGELIEAWA